MKLHLMIVLLFPAVLRADATADLIEAVQKGKLKYARAALEDGADVNGKPSEGSEHALGIASYRNDVAMINLLIQFGADVNQQSYCDSPLAMAANGLDQSRGKIDAMKVLLKAGADVNMVTCTGDTALFRCHTRSCIDLLIKAGADLGARNKESKTALDQAKFFNNKAVIKALKAAGAKE